MRKHNWFVWKQKKLFFLGQVQSGFPPIKPPPFSSTFDNSTYSFVDMCSHLGSGIIVVPIIAVLANVAIAKAFGIYKRQTK